MTREQEMKRAFQSEMRQERQDAKTKNLIGFFLGLLANLALLAQYQLDSVLRVFLRAFASSRSPLILFLFLPSLVLAQNKLGTNEVPYHQSKPPGPALSPEEAMAHMQLPPGFKIE